MADSLARRALQARQGHPTRNEAASLCSEDVNLGLAGGSLERKAVERKTFWDAILKAREL